ncbi:MAG TPA: hypothetical protein VK308_14505 [Pyrinomonadaceae bacterium]|nr:hypothetical protein [Pyrinomonadaceae bacterium]
MKDNLKKSLFLDAEELVCVTIHNACGGRLDWVYLSDRDGTGEQLKRLENGEVNSISTMPESRMKNLPLCRCDYDFPEILTGKN